MLVLGAVYGGIGVCIVVGMFVHNLKGESGRWIRYELH